MFLFLCRAAHGRFRAPALLLWVGLLFFLLGFPRVLLAATPANSTDSLAWLWSILLQVGTIVLPLFATWLLSRITVHVRDQKMMADLQHILQDGARMALDELGCLASHNITLPIKNKAIRNAVDVVLARGQALADKFGYTESMIGSIIGGEIAKALIVPTDTPAPTVAAAVAPAPTPSAPTA